jgi:hypothetical protein
MDNSVLNRGKEEWRNKYVISYLNAAGVSISGAAPEPAEQEQEVEKVTGASSEPDPVTTPSEKTSAPEPAPTAAIFFAEDEWRKKVQELSGNEAEKSSEKTIREMKSKPIKIPEACGYGR